MPAVRPPHATRGGTLRGPASVVSEEAWERRDACEPSGPTSVSVNASCARGPFQPHVNPITRAWATPPTCTSRGLRAYQRVNAHVQGFACEQHTEIDTDSAKVQTHWLKMTDFGVFLPNGSAVWRAHRLTSWPHHHQTGGNGVIRTTTRRRHTATAPLMLQNPHTAPASGTAASNSEAQAPRDSG